MSFNIAIDGPAGAGKSTIAKQVAAQLGYVYVDTGAMYRAISLYLIRKNIEADDVKAIEAVLDDIDITLEYDNGTQIVMLNGENVNGLIRTEEVGAMTHCQGRPRLHGRGLHRRHCHAPERSGERGGQLGHGAFRPPD